MTDAEYYAFALPNYLQQLRQHLHQFPCQLDFVLRHQLLIHQAHHLIAYGLQERLTLQQRRDRYGDDCEVAQPIIICQYARDSWSWQDALWRIGCAAHCVTAVSPPLSLDEQEQVLAFVLRRFGTVLVQPTSRKAHLRSVGLFR